jgi:MoxR-like ATPase
MTQILPQLGIYGWPLRDENFLLASLLTGDPLLMIGNHGAAKTGAATKVAETLGRRFIAYDASKALFEDVLGYPNVQKLQQGVVEYIGSSVTIFDKEFVLLDELNRALPEMQSKWLEIIRSRRIMGFETNVRWVWAAMNPCSYAGAQALDEALAGRFAFFVYPPDALSMSEEDRIRVARHLNGDDAPALAEWGDSVRKPTVSAENLKSVGAELHQILTTAAKRFRELQDGMPSLAEFLAKFADLLNRETKGELQLDGRRLGFIYRNLLAVRAIELAKGEAGDFRTSARATVLAGIPVGLNDKSVNRQEVAHQVEIVFDLLDAYFIDGSEIEKVNLIYELFTSRNLIRKAEILLRGNLNEMVRTKAWNDLIKSEEELTPLAYVALQIEARRPGTIPGEMIDHLGKKICVEQLGSACLDAVQGDSVEHVDAIEALLHQPGDLEKLLAIARLRDAIPQGGFTPEKIQQIRDAIRQDTQTFQKLLETPAAA